MAWKSFSVKHEQMCLKSCQNIKKKKKKDNGVEWSLFGITDFLYCMTHGSQAFTISGFWNIEKR